MVWATAAGIYMVICNAFLLFDDNTSQQLAKNPNEFLKGVGLDECWCSWPKDGVSEVFLPRGSALQPCGEGAHTAVCVWCR